MYGLKTNKVYFNGIQETGFGNCIRSSILRQFCRPVTVNAWDECTELISLKEREINIYRYAYIIHKHVEANYVFAL